MQNYLSPKSAAEYLGVSLPTIYRWTSERKITHYKPTNGRVYFKREDLDALMASGRVEATVTL